MIVRRADADDAAAVTATFTAAFAQLTYLPKLHTPEEDKAFFARQVEEHEVWLVEDDGRVLGFAALSDDLLEHIYVHPDAQGRGLGSALLDTAKRAPPRRIRALGLPAERRRAPLLRAPWAPARARDGRLGERGAHARRAVRVAPARRPRGPVARTYP